MSTLLGAAMILPALTLSSVADAQEARGLARFDRDMTRAWSNFEVRYTSFLFDDSLRPNYGDRANGVFLSGGPQIFRVLEVDFGIGFTTKRGFSTNSGGDDSSGQVARMRFVPLSVGITARAHIIDEQPVVPFVSIGGDWVYWREDTLIGDTTTPFGSVEPGDNPAIGSKGGWHWEVGGQILLDWLSPKRASILEASTGINDTWLTITYRRQNIGGGQPSLSGGALHIGLQLDY